ncbi:UbiX family flavin prenyltransferase [Desulfothermus okinawensis]
MKKLLLAITGASGTIYGLRLFEYLLHIGVDVDIIVSSAGKKVLFMENQVNLEFFKKKGVHIYTHDQIDAPPASGSYRHNGMVICPCSMATLGAIANGFGNNLIHRSADVTLKEGRKLILVLRETPLNTIHIENMLKTAQSGATIFPACPGFYNKPKTISDLVDHIVCRILDQLGIENNISPRWEGKP